MTTLSKGLPSGARSSGTQHSGQLAPSQSTNLRRPRATQAFPAQQVQAVVYADATISSLSTSIRPASLGRIRSQTEQAVALALQQYQDLTASVTQPGHVTTNPTTAKSTKGGGSTTRTVGFVLLGSWPHRSGIWLSSHGGVAAPRRPQSGATQAPVAFCAEPAKASRRIRRRARREGIRKEPRSCGKRIPVRSAIGTTLPQNRTPGGELRPAGGDALPPGPLPRKPTETGWLASASGTGALAREERLESSRTKHPSAATVLAHARPKRTDAGWYEDPSDSEHRRHPLLGRNQLDCPCGRRRLRCNRSLISQPLSREIKFGCSLFA